jgi:hypothetical protein
MNLKRMRRTYRKVMRTRRKTPLVTKTVPKENSQVPGEGSSTGGGGLNSAAKPYKLTLKDILQPSGNKVEKTTVLLNDLCEELIQGNPINHIPKSKKT